MKKMLLFGLLCTIIVGCTTQKTQQNNISIALGYIENIQFAPFYVAKELGYFKQESFDTVDLIHGFSPDILPQVANQKYTFALADGDEIIKAKLQEQSLSIEPFFGFYQTFPVTLIALDSTPLSSLQDIVGKKVGIPGEFGASYDGLLLALVKAGIPKNQLSLQSIGYTQVEQLVSKNIDIAVGYANNEPITLDRLGKSIKTLPLSDYVTLSSATVVMNSAVKRENPSIAKHFSNALQQGMLYVYNNPEQAVRLSYEKGYIPITSEDDIAASLLVLKASIKLWGNPENFGEVNTTAWQESENALQNLTEK